MLGEIEVYRQLHADLSKSKAAWYVWHDLKLPSHADQFNHYNKTSCQIDFLIVCRQGILVLEVKGGNISFKDNQFYYGKHFNEKMQQDPFRQAEGCKYTLMNKILNNLNKCFYCHAVSLPHVDYNFESAVFDSNLLWTRHLSGKYNRSLESFLLAVFSYSKELHQKFGKNYPDLDDKELEAVRKILSPMIMDRNRLDVNDTLKWLQIDNVEILESLSRNKRIMIEGPPGSGKTTLAKAFIDQQVGKRGLYLCWNNLLMHYTAKVIYDRTGTECIEVFTMIRFLKKLAPDINIQSVLEKNEDDLYELVRTTIDELEAKGRLPHYDYIVVDEGQDLFDRGIDIILSKMCGYNKRGLIDGTILMLYDIDQGFAVSGRNVLEIAHVLSDYFSHFKLNEVKRSAQNPNIKAVASRVLLNPLILLDKQFLTSVPRIRVQEFTKLENIKRYLVNNVLNQIRNENSSLKGGQCVLLIESALMKETYRQEMGMEFWMTIRDVETLTEANVANRNNKLRYTSILKYKGLEKENVFLVVQGPSEQNKYELYVGITRAIFNVEILMIM